MEYCNLSNAVDALSFLMFNFSFLLVLFIVTLDNNVLTGLIPSEVGLMTSLTGFELGESIVEPGILQPWQCCECVAIFDAQLFLLFIDALGPNTLTGLIPSEVGLLTSLTRLNLCE